MSPEPERDREDQPLKELAEAEIKLSSLILDFGSYKRRFSRILKSPLGFFRGFERVERADAAELKQSVTFMLQGISLAFLIFTASWSLPRVVAGYAATQVPLIGGSRSDLDAFRERLQHLNRTLPADLMKTWREQEELMLALRVLPEPRFRHMLERLADLKQSNPELLTLAIDGSFAHGERFGGRGYILTFFLALDPGSGPFLHDTWQLTSIGPKRELPPHVDFLLRNILLWYLTGFLVSRLVRTGDRRTPFAMAAFLVGFLSPLYQAYTTIVHLYLAATLPAYIRHASLGVIGGVGGVFPFENLLLAAARMIGPALLVGFAVAALAAGLQSAGAVSRNRAWTAAVLGTGLALGFAEAATFLLTLILAPTGLLS
jgi:hypothetical protein